MYPPAAEIRAKIAFRLPEGLYRSGETSHWIAARRGGPLHSFLEGPSFDRQGKLYAVDLAHGRILCFSPDGEASVFADYEGEPNGLKIHRDGRIFVADRMHGLLVFDPAKGTRETRLAGPGTDRFHGLNDLAFSSTGDLYFTDQGDSALEAPYGRVFRLRASGELDLLMEGLAGPNGLVLNREETLLYVAVTRTNQVLSLPLLPDYRGIHKAGVFLQLSGSPTGPDGMALDEDGNLAVVHAGAGTVWLFSRLGEPLFRIRSSAGLRTTNVAYGGADRRMLFVTEAERGVILEAAMPAPGALLYSHM
ncbi:SMP-30/gluconolactonase/LRE family protein [Mesorhizobium sp. CU2]|uniref:SMP-30/gluconolactonase/LRE family protein n=1 Tax=unclassified Mesorhizobium TaxID=325217 RepID=UPI00112CBE67|nr:MULTISPECIES: SMP-30/gluconolactonase/LRE family protein [unclassified Mesorhizobium]TPN85587.1 SMP-30/gluconolactonase/LRE family protein [Mesorhizobium sp. CU3]TPO02652.1 SMP-30/gluconolactonase/LRE family protein [Mesorhizobium sp. CU2]